MKKEMDDEWHDKYVKNNHNTNKNNPTDNSPNNIVADA